MLGSSSTANGGARATIDAEFEGQLSRALAAVEKAPSANSTSRLAQAAEC